MTVQVWTTLFVVLTFGLYTAIAWWTRASSTREFYVAGKGVSPLANGMACLLYTSPSPRDRLLSRMPSSA